MMRPSQHSLWLSGLADELPIGAGALLVALPAFIYSLFRSIYTHRTRILPACVDIDVVKTATRQPLPPSTLPVLGNLVDMARQGERLHDWFAELSRHFLGQAFRLCIPGKPDLVVLSSPADFQIVQQTQADHFIKGANFHDLLADLLGDSLFIVNGEQWKRQRRILARLFSSRALRCHMTPIIQAHTRSLLLQAAAHAAETGEELDVSALTHRFTLATFTEIGFGIDMASLAEGESSRSFEQAFDEAVHLATDRFRQPVSVWKALRWLNIGTERRLRDAIAVVNTTATDLITQSMARRRAMVVEGSTSATASDITSLLLADDSEEGLDAAIIRSLVVTALVAGRDTTADTLNWFLLALSGQPWVQTKLRDELLAAIPDLATSPTYVPSMDEIQHLPYLEASIREVLRLYPAGPFTVKQCVQDTVLSDGSLIPSGADVGFAVYAMGRLESVWGRDACEFKPERFLDETTGELKPMSNFQFSAFSAGERQCVGRRLAMLELKLALAALVARFRFSGSSPRTVQEQTYVPGVSLPMKTSLLMRVHRL